MLNIIKPTAIFSVKTASVTPEPKDLLRQVFFYVSDRNFTKTVAKDFAMCYNIMKIYISRKDGKSWIK